MNVCINCDHPELCHEGPERGLDNPVRGFICHRINGDLHQCECSQYTQAPVNEPLIGTSFNLSAPSIDDINAIMKLALGQAREEHNKFRGKWDDKLTE
jgi:hypothetical protein